MKKVLSAFLALALLGSAASATHAEVSPDAVASNPWSTVRVVVQWNSPVGAATAAVIGALGGAVVSEFSSLNQGVYTLPAFVLTVLGQNPLVQYVSLDRVLHRKLAYSAAAINAPAVWQAGHTGAGIGVAIIDSGVNQDANLGVQPSNTIVYTQDFTLSLAQFPAKPFWVSLATGRIGTAMGSISPESSPRMASNRAVKTAPSA
jgi:subtilisin family serine protease